MPDFALLARSYGLWLVGAVSFAAVFYLSRNFIFDDAYISYRYAYNFLNHGELAWNLSEPVEGYTNFLLVLITSAFMKLGFDPVTAIRGVNVVSAIVMLLAFVQCARSVAPGPENALPRALGGLYFLSSICFPIWILGGLETVLMSALLFLSITVLLPRFLGLEIGRARLLWAGLLFGLAYLSRPDAIFISGATLLAYLTVTEGSVRRRVSDVLLVSIVLSIIVAGHLLWRIDYYGALLPNTFHAKVGIDISQRLTVGSYYFFTSLPKIPALALAIGLYLVVARGRGLSPVIRLLITCILVQILYVIWAGGDHLPVARFFVPVLAPSALLIVALASLCRSWAIGFVAGFGCAVALASVILQSYPYHGGAESGKIVGQYIDENWPKDWLIALNVAGATPYFAPNHRFIDTLGLNDSTIARRQPIPMRTRLQKQPGHAKVTVLTY